MQRVDVAVLCNDPVALGSVAVRLDHVRRRQRVRVHLFTPHEPAFEMFLHQLGQVRVLGDVQRVGDFFGLPEDLQHARGHHMTQAREQYN